MNPPFSPPVAKALPKGRRWAIQLNDGQLYSGTDFTRPAGQVVVSEGQNGWPAHSFVSVENADKCLRWLGGYERASGAKVVEVVASWRVVQ